MRGKEIGRMRQAIAEVKAWFGQFEGVSNLAEDLRPGKPELRLQLRKGAATYGIKVDEVAQQLRASFHGVIADEIQVGPESYEIYVRTAAKDQDSLADLEYFDVILSDGRQIPLSTLVRSEQGRGWARVARFDGMRAITLRGDVDARVAIPFALIGVIWGHILMGVQLSAPSILGFFALAGIVVNDSILLVVFLKNTLAKGKDLHAAAEASRSRFRAVLLTSATTIAGLLPILFEQSLQAQILIPLIISTAFGLMASTVLVILVIPCLYVILGDLGLIAHKTSGPEEGSLKETATAVTSE